MIDFRSLSYFLVACEHENLGSAARTLDIAPSTLSASLKALEAALGSSLFRKQGSGLAPRQLAHWLYRAAVPLLLLEDFARRRVRHGPDGHGSRLQIDIRLRFAFGQFRRALANTIADTAEAEPLMLADPVWPSEEGAFFGAAALDLLQLQETHFVRIEAVSSIANLGLDATVLRADPWMLVRRAASVEDGVIRPNVVAGQKLLVPAFPSALTEQIVDYVRAQGGQIEILNTPPDDWPKLLELYPSSSFPLPTSAVGTRLGVSRIEVTPLDPPIMSYIIGRSDHSKVAGRFLDRLKAAFEDDRPSTAFKPVLTGRRIRYFNLAYELGRVSAAARAASVAQPAMSQQLQKLEESIGTSLFDRRTSGLIRTRASAQFALATNLLDSRLRELQVSGATANLSEGGRLSLGVLPSVSHHGLLINRVTDAMLALREIYPQMTLDVREAPNGTLQNWVLRGDVGLAIVETAPTQLPRLPLDASEELAVIVDPRHALLPPGPVLLEAVPKLPLVLPTALFGIRQALDAAAHIAGSVIRPIHEINALSMLIAFVRRQKVATVLPASAVQLEINSGELVAHPIREPSIHRRLYVIYSGDRSLTPAERDLVRLLRANLAT